MPYKSKDWRRRFYARTDISTCLLHATRPSIIEGKEYSAVDILLRILKEEKLIGSTTESGFIVGDKPAVCFQETPLVSFAQHLHYEKERSKIVRYSGIGLMFLKGYVYKKGGRPVIYETTEKSKAILSNTEWWRIVDLNYEDENNVTDWTHEREWRYPGDFTFEREKACVIVYDKKDYHEFIEKCYTQENNPLKEIQGIVTLNNLIM